MLCSMQSPRSKLMRYFLFVYLYFDDLQFGFYFSQKFALSDNPNPNDYYEFEITVSDRQSDSVDFVKSKK